MNESMFTFIMHESDIKMNPIAQIISETRKIKGLTQEELAEQAKVNLRTIQRIENDESKPRGKTLKLICDALDIDIGELVSNEEPGKAKKITTQVIDGLFLVALNLVLMGVIGFLTLDSNANLNSIFGGFMVSIFIPYFIVTKTMSMSGTERMLKFGFGYITYFILVLIMHGFPTGFVTGLFPCLLISISVLYFGNKLIKNRE